MILDQRRFTEAGRGDQETASENIQAISFFTNLSSAAPFRLLLILLPEEEEGGRRRGDGGGGGGGGGREENRK